MPNSLTSLIHLVAWYKIQVWSSQQNSVVVFSVCDLNSWHWNRKIGKFGYWLGLTLSELISCSPHGTSRNLNPARSPDLLISKLLLLIKNFLQINFHWLKKLGILGDANTHQFMVQAYKINVDQPESMTILCWHLHSSFNRIHSSVVLFRLQWKDCVLEAKKIHALYLK